VKHLLLVLCAVALAWPASGADWLKFGRATQTVTALDARAGIVWASTSPAADENSPMLSVSQCENFDIFFYEDMDDGGGSANEVEIYSCGAAVDGSGVGPTNAGFNPAGICWVIENATLDGDETANTESIYGVAGVWIYADVSTWVAVTPLVVVHCNP
jgi:hypothetical protein